MKAIAERIYGLKIWVRLVIFIWLLIAIAGSAVLFWAFHVQRQTAIEQAMDFAESVHQMTLAGLTGMMITGTGSERAVFLDQIERSNNILDLRVLRSDAVIGQFGPGLPNEAPIDAVERQVLIEGQPVFQIRRENDHEILKAVLPALAQRDYLGKDCLGCHGVAEGTVLGAVSMQISLEKVNAAVAAFAVKVSWTAASSSIPLILLIYFSLSRSVTRPLRAVSDGLDRIAAGGVELGNSLPVRGADEIAEATTAFNRAIAKAHQMVKEERISADVFEHALEGILVTDRQARILKVNPAFTRTTGYSAAEAIGKTPRLLQSGQHDRAFYDAFWNSLITRGHWQGDIWNKRKNGEVYPQWLNVSSVKNELGEIECFIAIFSDITERKRQEALISYQAFHDSLTGLPNRALFRDRLGQALAIARRHRDQSGAVMFLDLDRFKFINDSLGHDVGDQLLKEVARRLRMSVRAVDTVARLGGDEFTVLLPGIIDPKGAETVAGKILANARQPYFLNDMELFVTVSIGISFYPADGEDPETLMKNADTAMYHIKEQGRAGYCFYSPELSVRTEQHLLLETELHHALKHGEFEVFYQPQIHLESGRILGVEALVRWNHPRQGLVPAGDFLHLCEETGLIVPIGEWVLRTACQALSSWFKQGHDLTLSINLSPRQFHHDNLVDTVVRALAASQLPARCLELEVAESLAMQDLARTTRTLGALAARGVRLAITEFGAGFHSSVHDLKRLPVNAIKIDRAFVRDLNADQQNAAFIESMIKLSREPNMRVVAMGVENDEQLLKLRAMRCDGAQGHLISEPLAADRISALLDRALIASG